VTCLLALTHDWLPWRNSPFATNTLTIHCSAKTLFLIQRTPQCFIFRFSSRSFYLPQKRYMLNTHFSHTSQDTSHKLSIDSIIMATPSQSQSSDDYNTPVEVLEAEMHRKLEEMAGLKEAERKHAIDALIAQKEEVHRNQGMFATPPPPLPLFSPQSCLYFPCIIVSGWHINTQPFWHHMFLLLKNSPFGHRRSYCQGDSCC
jgi:hypothetical protein